MLLANFGEGKIVSRMSVDDRTRHFAKAAWDRMLSFD